jgi:hypothetical protein
MDFDEEAGRVWANIDALCLDAFALDGEELDAHRARYPAAIAAALRGAADEAERRGHEAGMVGWRLSCGLPVSDEAVALDDRLRRERFGEWPPVPKPDEAPNPFARLYGACPDLPEPNPVSQPPAQPSGEGDVLGRPVTYRAGTVPAKIVAGMVLRSLGGRTATVVSHGPKWASLIDDEDGREYVVPVARLADCWTLARDFTEPGGGES